jgi:hypothetical protein
MDTEAWFSRRALAGDFRRSFSGGRLRNKRDITVALILVASLFFH